ncbi:MAG: helix-turn-helix domain-containing protein [SAR324 cluster bacterium]|nr:helix-turn-helix domain-containing protein [SAR324 cluster bacterium]MDP7331827.1 helix-turn-helix domain-containing protein [SAR324 cluster bacterium]
MSNQTIPGWLTTEQACQILRISYSKFRRNIMPNLDSVQPSGRCGPRFFQEAEILEYAAEADRT